MAKILVVDDEMQLLEYTKPSLEKRGYEVITASTAQEAMEIYPKENPEIVLLDLGLPGTNGRDVLKDIKAKAPQIKVVIISGYTDPDTKKELISLGADYFLNKPVIPAKLYELIKEILGKDK
jgi:DNA-binding response OmpR family regulator